MDLRNPETRKEIIFFTKILVGCVIAGGLCILAARLLRYWWPL